MGDLRGISLHPTSGPGDSTSINGEGWVECPCCHQPFRPKAFPTLDLNTNTFINASGSIRLGPRQAEVLHVIIEAFPSTINRWDIINRVWPSTPKDPTNLLWNTIALIRRAINPLGWDIKNEHSLGYRLQEMKHERP